jgi:general secretion pathway protein L
MNVTDKIRDGFWRWIDLVAEGLVASLGHFRKHRTVCLVEAEPGCFVVRAADIGASAGSGDVKLRVENGTFAAPLSAHVETALRGSRLELLVRPDRFVFKPLELPSRAAEFLEGVVRSQIDRLTPWSADQAAFGSTMPADLGSGRIVVTIAATAKAMLTPILQAFSRAGARSIVIRTAPSVASPDMPAIKIVEENMTGVLDVNLVRRVLIVTLACALLVSLTAAMVSAFVGGNLQTRQDELARQIARQRSALLMSRNAAGDPKTLAEQALLRRKNESPSDVIALEILSKILPDTTYVTEMHIEANKLQLTGITHDAPQLIRLIEQTRHFSQATFFAPITRSPSDSRDHFSIEARMEPNFSLTP